MPVFATPVDWGTVSLADEEIVPSTTYHVAVENTLGTSGPSVVSTPLWGDVAGFFDGFVWTPPDGDVDFVDISAVVDRFKHLPTAPALERCDLNPAIPDYVVDFVDISLDVDAFKGFAYPFDGPDLADCP